MFLAKLPLVEHKDELGGHSSVFAQVGQKEECNVYIAAQGSDFYKRTIPYTEESSRRYLRWPTREVNEAQGELDTHFVFEYNEGDVILGYKAPRSNRMYFVTDPNGANFKQMESYHKYLSSVQVSRHMFGGY